MSITSVNGNVASIVPAAIKPVYAQPDLTGKNESTITTVKDADNKQSTGTTDKSSPSENDFRNVTDELNNFMQSMNTNITFELHTRTTTLMVLVEDSKTHKVLKECPAHELLDMVARLRDYVGALLDQKA